ncbi:MAG TPA: glycosyltransferase, partial [Roseiflexaceae bacterium]|nr:glycosyltransferase [Roseiflexaceae bacterium]
MRILHIYKDYAPVVGGIENHVRDLGEGLARRGYAVRVLVTGQGGQRSIAIEGGVEVVRAARFAHAASTPLSLDMLQIARTSRADIVHLHFPYPPGDLAAFAVPGHPPLVVTYHSDIVRQQQLLRIYRPLLERTMQRARRVIATSPDYVQSSPVLQRYRDKCVVVPLGIDVARFAECDATHVQRLRAHLRGSEGAAGLVLFVGRLRYYKGLHVLLDALAQLEGARLVIVGSGPEFERLQAQARALGIAGRLVFAGDVGDDDLPLWYQACDVFALPAHVRAEALGIAQIEAMASGLPCVCTALGTGTSFVNLHGETGLVVPPGDAGALAQA